MRSALEVCESFLRSLEVEDAVDHWLDAGHGIMRVLAKLATAGAEPGGGKAVRSSGRRKQVPLVSSENGRPEKIHNHQSGGDVRLRSSCSFSVSSSQLKTTSCK
jgi:hypothetical protein